MNKSIHVVNGLTSRWIELHNTSLNTIQVQNNCDKLRSFSMKRRKNKTLYRKSHCLAIEELYFIYLRERKSERVVRAFAEHDEHTTCCPLCIIYCFGRSFSPYFLGFRSDKKNFYVAFRPFSLIFRCQVSYSAYIEQLAKNHLQFMRRLNLAFEHHSSIID